MAGRDSAGHLEGRGVAHCAARHGESERLGPQTPSMRRRSAGLPISPHHRANQCVLARCQAPVPGCKVSRLLANGELCGDGGPTGEAVAAAWCDSVAGRVLVTGPVRWAALLVSQVRTTLIQRGADIPG